MDIDSLSLQILKLLSISGIGSVKVNKLIDLASSCNIDLKELLEDKDMASKVLNDKQIEALLAQGDSVLNLYADILENDIKPISIVDENYPKRVKALLKTKSPPLLFVRGNESILNKTSIGFCGSRQASEKAILAASEFAYQLSGYDVNVVSGYAKGIDMTTHYAALESGGTTTLVLPEGIFNFRIKRELKPIWGFENAVVVSEFFPKARWSVANAMQRNKTICALSEAIILIEAKSTGGSIEAGKAAMSLNIPTFAVHYGDNPETAEGNQLLVNQGARPLGKDKHTGKANIKRVLAAINLVKYEVESASPLQLNLLNQEA
jgi:DNA processing protein